MSTTDGGSQAKLLAVVLQGEDNYWFAEPRTSKPLDENWSHVGCFWLYPVEFGIAQFADLQGFDPTDSVFEIDTHGVSKVLRAATLSYDVTARKYDQGRRTFYFITQKEINRLDLCYSALLKREAEILPSSQKQNDGVQGESGTIKVEDLLSEVNQEKKVNHLKSTHFKENEGDTTKEFKSNAIALSDKRSHQRKTPYQGTTVYLAPTFSTHTGDHCSNEAFEWQRYYIIHRGSVDYLVPKPVGNTYGFRLDKVSHDGFPVFLLYGSTVNNSYEVESYANAVPAMDSALLKGGGGETDSIGTQVLVLTRQRGKRKRMPTTHGSADAFSFSLQSVSELPSRSTSYTDDSGSEAKAPPLQLAVPAPRRRGRPRKVPLPTPLAESEVTTSRKVTYLSLREHYTSHESSFKTNNEHPEPLQTCSVNVWTDLTSEIPPLSQLVSQFPFQHNPSESLCTTVFPDGICATYSPTTAVDFLKVTDTKKNPNGGNQLVSTGGSSVPIDDDMRNLLEHIQLAKQQINA
ncbi:unnamed protein product [Phytomonas sp. Hart1]|nr:unnamed protein product [Phytomonas sp. Hart1]|eukprot:CCW70558.1 unnamed protein product [Phytomonas sp. isolate Hart1]